MNIHKSPLPAMVKATLYFGANIPDGLGSFVADFAFRDYLKEFVTPHFPGFTVTTAQGYWKGEPEVVRCLTILATDTDAFRNQIRWFAEQYKTRFLQEAVAYDFTPCEFTLDCWPYGPVKTYHTPGKGY